jgi:hypothetical protein
MAKEFELVIYPWGGLNEKVNEENFSLLSPVGQSATKFISQAVGGSNWENAVKTGCCQKIKGHTAFNEDAIGTGDRTQEIFYLDDGTYQDLLVVYAGKMYTVTSSAVTEVAAASPVTFITGEPISLLQYGSYIIIGSIGITPYKWKHGDANSTKLINKGAATEYKFKYFESFHNRIIGAFSDQTNGNIDIRYTDALPNMSALDFPAANQLYKPDSDIGITGIKRLGNIACLVYGRNSIHSMDFQPDYTPCFSLTSQITGLGTDAHWSIVDMGDSHYFYDRSKGFVRYAGGREYEVISDPIADTLSSILDSKVDLIYGKDIPLSNEVVWIIPAVTSGIPQRWCYYNVKEKKWRIEERTATALCYLESLESYSAMDWETWIDSYGGDTALWSAASTDLWSVGMILRYNRLVFGNDTSYLYSIMGNDFAGNDFDAYRIEPVLSAPDPSRRKRLQSIEVVSPTTGAFSLDFYWRGGETNQEVTDSAWELLGSVSMASTSTMVLYFDKTEKFHQFKWGTDLKEEPFEVSQFKLRGIIY